MTRPLPAPPDIEGTWRTDARARAAYAEGAGIYRIVPAAVCVPAGEHDLRPLVRWAERHGVGLVPRGAGSAMSGGNVGDGVIVDLQRLRGTLRVDAGARRLTAGAAHTYAEIGAAAAAHGLRVPPDPSSGAWATIGGMVSTNAAGARSVRYGSIRRWVTAVRLVTGDGEAMTLARAQREEPGRVATATSAIRAAADEVAARWPRVRKNAAGYALDEYLSSGDVVDLVIGAEGTLGFVTEVELALAPLPRATTALRVTLASLDALSAAVEALLPFEPSALELLDRSFLDVAAPSLPAAEQRLVAGAGAVLLAEFETLDESSFGAPDPALDAAVGAVRPHAESVEAAVDPADVHRLWEIRHAASPTLAALPEGRRSLQVIEDACVPLAAMSGYIRAVRAAGDQHEVPLVIFGHAGDGNVHVNLLPDVREPGWERRVAAVYDEAADAVLAAGGTFTGEHGDGRLRTPLLERLYGPRVVELFGGVKRAFDPHAIFNPGVIMPLAGADPISRLKVGADAAALPPDIAAALRDIERSRGYGRSRLELA